MLSEQKLASGNILEFQMQHLKMISIIKQNKTTTFLYFIKKSLRKMHNFSKSGKMSYHFIRHCFNHIIIFLTGKIWISGLLIIFFNNLIQLRKIFFL